MYEYLLNANTLMVRENIRTENSGFPYTVLYHRSVHCNTCRLVALWPKCTCWLLVSQYKTLSYGKLYFTKQAHHAWRYAIHQQAMGVINRHYECHHIGNVHKAKAWGRGNGPLIRYVNCGLRMRRECRERFPRHQSQRKPLVNDPVIHHGTWRTCRDECLDRLLEVTGKTFPAFPAHAQPAIVRIW